MHIDSYIGLIRCDLRHCSISCYSCFLFRLFKSIFKMRILDNVLTLIASNLLDIELNTQRLIYFTRDSQSAMHHSYIQWHRRYKNSSEMYDLCLYLRWVFFSISVYFKYLRIILQIFFFMIRFQLVVLTNYIVNSWHS